jgi:hypothetical protein
MSQFLEWLKKRSIKEGLGDNEDPTANFKFNTNDEDFADDHDQTESEVFKIVLRKYPDETMDFLYTIAQRGDEEVSSLLRKLDKGRGERLSKAPRHPSQDDEIVPPAADTGNSEYDGNEQ